ncbi:hypothetical protein ACG7TL_003826 [Trametes sanguinea]
MKLIGKRIEKDGSGHVTVVPEDDEDMWHLYNLIQEGDRVRASGIRRVQNVSATGSVDSYRIRINLTLAVTRVNWSPSTAPGAESGNAAGSSNSGPTANATVEVTGRVAEENMHVKLGAYHTLAIEANKNVRIEKDAGGWDSIALGRVEESCVPGRGAEVAAIGLARFYQSLYQSFLRHVPYSSPTLRAIVIASPGWVRDAVFDYIMSEANRTSNKPLLAARNKFIKVHVNSPHVHSLVEALKSPEIAAQLKETKFAREGMMLDRFFKMLASDEMRAWYGPDHVALAADRGAIGTLLISDELFRSSDAAQRKKYVAIVEDVKQKGGEVLIFSSMHESGQQLNQLTGIAAILTFPLDIEVVEAEEREAKEEEERRKAEENGTSE